MSMDNEYFVNNSADGESFFIAAPLEIFRKIGATLEHFSVLEARLFNMPPADYLKMLREKYNAELLSYKSFIAYHIHTKAQATTHARELTRRYQAFMKE